MDNSKVLCGRFTRLFFVLYNAIFYFAYPFRKRPPSIPKNPKILLCCWASLGDVLLASSVIAELRRKWPSCKIGFLCAPASFPVIEKNEDITHIHQVPSWMVLGHSKMRNLISLLHHFFFVYPKGIREIKKLGYDMSLELYPFFPSCIPLMQRAGITRRVAFTSGGYDIWITDPVDLSNLGRYLPDLYSDLLEKIGVEKKEASSPSPSLKKGCKAVLHLGTSDVRKEWKSSFWHTLGKELKEQGYEIVLTGKGSRDRALIEDSGLASLGRSLCDQLDYFELVEVIKEARIVISIDSLPVHLSALYGVPFVGLYLYNANVELWLPNVDNCYLLVQNNCTRRCREKVHPRAIYLEEILAGDVISHVQKLLEETS